MHSFAPHTLALLASILLSACAGSGPASAVASPPSTPSEPAGEPKQCTPTQYAVKGACFDSRDDACKAAGCEAAKCLVAETAPMQIHCGG